MQSIAIRTVALLVIVGSLAASQRGIQLAWGVLYPKIEEFDPTERFDAIVVLSGEDRRIERGLELAEAGRAPVLVAMYGEIWSGTRAQCGTRTTYVTLCPVPAEDSTRGEARLIGQLASQKNWKSVLVVTGDYHVSRSRLLIERCVGRSVQVSFESIEWSDVGQWLLRSEVIKTSHATLIERSC